MSNNAYEFKKELYTNVDLIDKQHKELIDLANDLINSIDAKMDRETTYNKLNFLGNYIGSHFSSEEELQIESGYPNCDNHKEKHALFLETLLDLKVQFYDEGNTPGLQKHITDSVVDWVVKHILEEDVLFAKHYRQVNNIESPLV